MSKPENKLFLLDAMALIYRAHFAFSKNPRINSKGINTGAALGFTNSLLEIIKKEKPTHLGVAFDTSEPTFRHIEYPEYKAQREAQPEDIRVAIPYVKKIVEAFNIPVLIKPGFEADDIIGTIARQAGDEGFEVFMMTPDKDFAQLVKEHVYLYKPSFMGNGVDILGIPEVLKKFDIERVDQVIDILGLQGDAVDNIPGIPGVGAKTAIKFLKEYGSVEGLLKNTDKLKGKMKENVEANKEQALLSKKLATIKLDVPIDYEPDKLKYEGPNEEALRELFEELEFRTLMKRVLGEELQAAAKSFSKSKVDPAQMSMFTSASADEVLEDEVPKERKNITNSPHNYHLIDTPELREDLITYLELQDEFCFDTETTSLEPTDAELVGMAFSYVVGEAYYVPFPADQIEAQKIADEFKGVLEAEETVIIGQNLKYDIQVMRNYGVNMRGKIFDTMLAHYLLDPETRHNMDALAENILNYTTISITELIGKKGAKQGNMRDVPVEDVVDYACEDADITLQLKEVLEKEIEASGLGNLLHNVEEPLSFVLAEMEYEGVKIDEKNLAIMSKELEILAAATQQEIFDIAGLEFNIASPKQLGEVLFDQMKLVEKPKKTKTGQYATGEEILSKLANEHEIADKILTFREYQKLKSTYVDALPKLISKKDGRVHTDYRQAVAATGRLSSNNPNLQNIPIRTEKGKLIRKAFVPRDENYTLLSADYSQIELRIMAAFSKDEAMIDAFKSGRDIHATTAAKVFGVALEDVDPGMRRKAKEVNFGIIYGISAFGLGQNLNISRTEAADIIKAYFKEFPAVNEYMTAVVEEAREKEYVSTILGRKRWLRDINSRNQTIRGFAERNAVNAPIQGSAADMIKVAMINIHEWMKKEKLQSKMIMQVHDELIFDVHKDELATLEKHVIDFMKNAMDLDVPMEIGVGVADNWMDAH
jgi:DNA polymerase-1